METREAIEEIPIYIKDALASHTQDIEKIRLSISSDMNLECLFKHVWLFLTDENIIIIEGNVVPDKNDKKKVLWEEEAFTKHPLEGFKDLKVETLATSNMITASKDGEDFILLRFSNSLGRKMRAFASLFNKIIEGNEITEKDLKSDDTDNAFCKKCGKPLRGRSLELCSSCIDKKKVFVRLLAYGKSYSWYMVGIVIFILLSSLISLSIPYVGNKIFYDEVLKTDGIYYGKVLGLVGVLLLIRLVAVTISVLYARLNAVLSNRIVYNLRTDVFRSMQNLSLSFFTHRQTGALMTRVNRDAENVQWFFLDGMPYLIVNVINIVGISFLMISIRPILSLLVLIPAPFIFIFFRKWMPKFHKMFGRSHRSSAAMNSRMNDSFTGLRVVKAFGKEEKENEDFSKTSRTFSDIGVDIGITSSTVFPLISFIMWLGSLFIYIFGGILIINGKLFFGDVATLVGYVGMIYGPLQWFARLVQFWSRAMNSANRIFEVIDAKAEVQEIENPIELEDCQGHVKIDNISFSYEPNREILKEISFEVTAGEHIGVVGHSGAGKSTLVNLINRLYDVDNGGIYIDGVNIKDLSFKSLKDQIGIVLQDTYLFIGTIGENIAYAKPEATRLEIVRAAKAAYAHEFIMNLPDGYDTRIGLGGHGLSGGERQRVSLARAILKDPKILILDEATSAIDTKTESQIQRALEALSHGRTTFNIAHRLSTLRDVDRLIVLEEGKLIEIGSHEEVYALEGVYHKLFHIQKEALKVRGIE